jgi:serine protease Do
MEAHGLGFVVHELSDPLRGQYRLNDDVSGMVVVHVDQSSQAWEKGLREGDLIVEVNRSQVRDLAGFQAALAEAGKGELVSLYVEGPAASRFVTLRVPEE